jgi:hypothetical protein
MNGSTIFTFPTPNAGDHSVSASYAGDANFAGSTVSGTLHVNKAEQTITWAAPADIVYGTALSSAQLDATVSVPGPDTTAGALSYAPLAGTILDAGTQTLTVTAAATANYNAASEAVVLHVLKATPAITWSTPAPIVYGTALSDTQLDATATVPGTFLYSPAAGTVLNAGVNQTLSVTFTPTDTTNYNGSSRTVSLSVNKATLTITADNSWKIAGEANPAFTVSYSGFVLGQGPGVLGGALTFTTLATASSPPGTYAITPSGLTSANYALTFVSGTLTVLSPSQATNNLVVQVKAAILPQGIENALLSSLQAALESFDRGNLNAAVNQLKAFQNKVRAQSGQALNTALTDLLVAAAQRIMNAVTG